MPATLAEALSKDRVEFGDLERRYQPVLSLVKVLIGVVPKCDRYLEIWPPGFRTYNLLVPNFLNLPAGLLGRGAPKDVVGLGMYMSSRAASCAYCSAHTCSFALRRGSSPEAVTGQSRTPGEQATVAIAEALSTMPHHYAPAMGEELRRHFGPGDAEWITMGIAMMGFLNKFMDALGVELEPEAISDVADLIEPTGWSVGQHGWDRADSGSIAADDDKNGGAPPTDSLGTMLRVFRSAPGAIRLERGWLAGVPKDPAQGRRLIAETYGFDEPLLVQMRHDKPRRALAGMLRHNLDPDQSELGIGMKALAGLVFAKHADNDELATRSVGLAELHDVDAAAIKAAQDPIPGSQSGDLDATTAAVLAVANAMASSPAAVDNATVALASAELSSAQIVEIAVWISVCQTLHRLSLYFADQPMGA